MTLQQMSSLKRWHVMHRQRHPLEYNLWDAVLTCWLLGWVGTPAAMLLHSMFGLWLCLALVLAPSAYVAWRLRLHRRGRLRCDWSAAVAPPRA